ncbi:MAG: hypothetical protein ACRCVU_12320 [Flavobacterium sp.]
MSESKRFFLTVASSDLGDYKVQCRYGSGLFTTKEEGVVTLPSVENAIENIIIENAKHRGEDNKSFGLFINDKIKTFLLI